MDVDNDPNLVVVKLEHCVSSEGAHLGNSSCIYTTTMPTSSCHDMLQLATPVQCLNDINQSLSRLHQHQHLAQLQPLQYPQVQVSYDNSGGAGLQQSSSILPPPSSIYQSSTLHYSQPSFLTPLPPQPLHILESTLPQEPEHKVIALETPAPPPPPEECKYPADDYTYYKEIENYLLRGETPSRASDSYVKNLKTRAKHYLMNDGILYHDTKNPKKVVMMKEEQFQLLEEAHLVRSTGIHQGIKKMLSNLHDQYFWRGMYDAVANYVKKCHCCRDIALPNGENDKLRYQGSDGEYETLSVLTQTVSPVWSEVEISVHGPFKLTNGMNEFVVTIADPASCFVAGAPLPTNWQCSKIWQFILHTFYTFGFPTTKATLPGNLFEEISAELKWCLKRRKTPLTFEERNEKEQLPWVKQLMTLLVKRYPAKWDKELDWFLYQFRIGGIKQLNAKTGSSPFYSMYNRKHTQDVELDKENLGKSGSCAKKKSSRPIWQCRKCSDSFTSRIAYRFHVKNHRTKVMLPVDDSPLPLEPADGDGELIQFDVDKNGFQAPEDCVEETVNAVKAVLDETKNVRQKRGKYQKYSADLQHDMASYAAKHGSSKAAEHFSKLLGTTVSDSTIRNLVKSHSEFVPSLKEEIAEFAISYGIDRAVSHFTERLNKTVSPRMVRRFKNQFERKNAETPKNVDSCSKLMEDKDMPQVDHDVRNSVQHTIEIAHSFVPQPIDCPTATCFTQPSSMSLTQSETAYSFQDMHVVQSTFTSLPTQQIGREDNDTLVAQHFLLVTPDGGQSTFEMNAVTNKQDDKGSQTWVSEYQSYQVDQVFIDACPEPSPEDDMLQEPMEQVPEVLSPVEQIPEVSSPVEQIPEVPSPVEQVPQVPSPVEQVLQVPSPEPAASKDKKPAKPKKEIGKKRGSYSTYSPELRAEIGKYAAKHGSLKASSHFSELLGGDVAESTARALKQKYLLKVSSQKVKPGEVTSLGYSPRGRPLRLGKYDEVVQECLKELFRSGEKVTSFLAITTAKEVLNKYEPELLEENGGPVVLNTSWAKSFLKRIGVRNNS